MPRIPKPSGRKSRKPVLVSYGVHLVYAEGEKTEPLYVKNIKEVIQRNYSYHNTEILIESVPHEGYNTIGLVDFAIEDVKKRLYNNEKIDHVWIFYDKDSFPKDNFDNSHKRIISQNKPELTNDDGDNVDSSNICWHSLWSNQCFELWVLLHFEFLQSSINREDYIKKINSNYLSDDPYNKHRTDLYELLLKKGNIQNAITYSKRLQSNNGLENPSTGIFEFVEYFDKYLNKS